ncbi:hypothetical protein D5R38_18590 [Serratia marcescens]|uniref:hypothetical protein n=1 Tax=Serratia marcescens TaxID=615 RepID=UPI001067C46C|nr:hypothetical protein [Serratia marcescens]TEW83379.1 hypothetical protein D5R38_18590 [Serratia marcescens]
MPVTEYWELVVFDTYLEPQGSQFQDIVQAHQQLTAYATSPHMTEKAMKNIKLKNFTLLKHGPDDFMFLTEEQLKQKAYEDDKRSMEKMISNYQDPKVKETVRKKLEKQLREKHGKV